jgi:PAS domain S-box-containing protein
MVAVAVMAATCLLQAAVWPYIQPSPFLLLTLGVLVAGLHGEWAPGLLATALGALGAELFFLPSGEGAGRDVVTVTLFLSVGAMVTWINVLRRRSMRVASENEQWLGTTLSSIADAVIATDGAGRVRFLNRVAEELTGWRTHHAAGRTLGEVFRIASEATHTVLVARDGTERLIEDSVAPILDGRGNPNGAVLVFRDTTERTREDERRALLAEATEVLVGSLDVATTLAAVARLLVPRAADRIGVHLVGDGGAIEPLAVAGTGSDPVPGAAGGLDGALEEVAETGRAQQLAAALVVPLVARGRVLGVMTFELTRAARHFTARDLEIAEDLARRAADAIDAARLYQEAQQAIRLRDEFLAIASHELRTPLTTLHLQLQSLERRVDRLSPGEAEAIRRKLASASRQGERLANLVDNLLDVARITTGRLAIKPEWMDLVEVASEITERFQEQAVAAGCTLRLSAAEAHIDVHWDRLRIEQILSNLLSNAIKYGTGQPVDVVVDRGDDRARIVIRDRGIGIREADAERIFGRFERAVSARHYGGLGLGLFIARQIVEAHRGEIRVGASNGPGAEIVVSMPLSVAAPDQRAAAN